MNIYVNIDVRKLIIKGDNMAKLSELGAVLDEIKAKQDEANIELSGLIAQQQATIQSLTEQLAAALANDPELGASVEEKLAALRGVAEQMANVVQ